jgi:iron complex outermembrane receptor protein
MRVLFCAIFFMLLIDMPTALAQSHPADSVTELLEVSVYARKLQKHLIGNKISFPSQSSQVYYEGGNLSDLLQQQSTIHMKSYGNGMLSSIAFRGTTASQTSVIWNDFNINNYTLGQMDFSLIPVFQSDELILLPGGGSTYGGNGAIGGTIALVTALDYDATPQLRISGLVGSFGKYQSSIDFSGSVNKLAYTTSLYYQEAENDFPIASIDEKQPNAAFSKYGLKQQLGYQFNEKQQLELAIWYHLNERMIQPAMRNFNNIAVQQDGNIRSSLKYQHTGENYELKVGTGFFNDHLRYQEDRQISSYRTSRSESFMELDLFPLQHHQLTLEGRANVIQAYSDGFNPKVQNEQRYTWRLKATGILLQKLNYAFHIGQQMVSQTALTPFTPYIGVMYPLIKGDHQQFKIRANTSYNYRVPTLNDRFWELPDREVILAERALNVETGLEYSLNYHDFNWRITTTAFKNQIANYIQWIAVDGRARPMNIADVEIKGVEIESTFNRSFNNKLHYQLGMSYAFNDAKRLGLGNEEDYYLVYVPLHKMNASFSVGYQHFLLNYFVLHTSEVFTTAQNNASYAIPAFSLHDIGISYNQEQFGFSLKAKNILNNAYQTYLNYAMPGRNYELSINYTINLKSK